MNDIEGINDLEYRRALKALSRELEPGRDLWPGIAASLERKPARRARAPVWIGYALAAGIGCAAVVLGWRALPHDAAPAPQLATIDTASPWVLREARLLKADVDAALVTGTGLPSVSVIEGRDRALSASLKELDSAEAELDQALRLNPESTFLLDRLRHVQQRKSRLTLRSLAA